MRFYQKLAAIHQVILSVANTIGSAWIFVLMGIIVWDVAGRVFFNQPLQGTPELVSNSIITITFLQIPFVMYKKQHVRSTVLYSRFPESVQQMIDIVISIVGIVLFYWLITSGWKHFIVALEIGEFEGEGALRVPTAPARFALILGSALMILELGFTILRIVMPYFTEKERGAKS